jgi:hypothetical protein
MAVLLTLGIGVQLLELSGRWDQTIQDANDEAGIVAVVLCIGVALTTAGALLARMRLRRVMIRAVATLITALSDNQRAVLSIFSNGPPLSLRI